MTDVGSGGYKIEISIDHLQSKTDDMTLRGFKADLVPFGWLGDGK